MTDGATIVFLPFRFSTFPVDFLKFSFKTTFSLQLRTQQKKI